MKRIVIVGATAVVALLLVTGSICAQFVAGIAAGRPNQLGSSHLVAGLSPGERDLIRQVDIADCRARVVAGQETGLEAGDTAWERGSLMREPSLVVSLCSCKFEATAQFLTKEDMVTNWLSSTSPAHGGYSTKTQAIVDGALRDCAQSVGLRTSPVLDGPGLP